MFVDKLLSGFLYWCITAPTWQLVAAILSVLYATWKVNQLVTKKPAESELDSLDAILGTNRQGTQVEVVYHQLSEEVPVHLAQHLA
jgi:hypothetical protein